MVGDNAWRLLASGEGALHLFLYILSVTSRRWRHALLCSGGRGLMGKGQTRQTEGLTNVQAKHSTVDKS